MPRNTGRQFGGAVTLDGRDQNAFPKHVCFLPVVEGRSGRREGRVVEPLLVSVSDARCTLQWIRASIARGTNAGRPCLAPRE
jgi:hypothetical protein